MVIILVYYLLKNEMGMGWIGFGFGFMREWKRNACMDGRLVGGMGFGHERMEGWSGTDSWAKEASNGFCLNIETL